MARERKSSKMVQPAFNAAEHGLRVSARDRPRGGIDNRGSCLGTNTFDLSGFNRDHFTSPSTKPPTAILAFPHRHSETSHMAKPYQSSQFINILYSSYDAEDELSSATGQLEEVTQYRVFVLQRIGAKGRDKPPSAKLINNAFGIQCAC